MLFGVPFFKFDFDICKSGVWRLGECIPIVISLVGIYVL